MFVPRFYSIPAWWMRTTVISRVSIKKRAMQGSADYSQSNSKGFIPSASTMPHYPGKGWNVIFTDGSVKFIYSPNAYTLATKNLVTDETHLSHQLSDIMFNN